VSLRVPKLEPWERNVYAVAVAQFIALGGANLVIPFMPFYVRDLGVEDDGAVALWSGLLATATGAALFVFSPIWGSLADRYGRKPLLLRAYVGAMITMTLQGLATEVWHLLVLRLLQGAFVGTIPAATALVASSAPRQRVAYSLGILQMGLFLSQTVGPLAGGILSSTIGIRPTFIATGAFYSLSFLLVYALVEERSAEGARERGTLLGNLRLVLDRRPLLLLIGLIFFLNAGAAFVRPVVPLVVESFDSSMSAKTMSGFAFASLAVTSAISALFSSRVSSRVGYRNALAAATVCAGAAYLPVAAANNELSLILLFAFVGLFSGAMVPTANALIDSWAPPNKQAAAFGLAGSALALAIAIAPLSGGAVSAAAGPEASFIVIGCVLLVVGLAVLAFVREPDEEAEVTLVTAAKAGD
jgi:DHA1 family multidrug resistance protein-like MFS transporter